MSQEENIDSRLYKHYEIEARRKQLLIIIRNNELCKRLCQLVNEDWIEYNTLMMIILDRYRNLQTAKKIYNMLKSLGFIEESTDNMSLIEGPLSNPLRSKAFNRVLRRYRVKLDDLLENPDIVNKINTETSYFVEIEDGSIRVYKKLPRYLVRLTDLAKEICRELYYGETL